jgi:hypothetical protein
MATLEELQEADRQTAAALLLVRDRYRQTAYDSHDGTHVNLRSAIRAAIDRLAEEKRLISDIDRSLDKLLAEEDAILELRDRSRVLEGARLKAMGPSSRAEARAQIEATTPPIVPETPSAGLATPSCSHPIVDTATGLCMMCNQPSGKNLAQVEYQNAVDRGERFLPPSPPEPERRREWLEKHGGA